MLVFMLYIKYYVLYVWHSAMLLTPPTHFCARLFAWICNYIYVVIPLYIFAVRLLCWKIAARRSVQHVAHFSSADKENRAYSVACVKEDIILVCYCYRSIYTHTHVVQINHKLYKHALPQYAPLCLYTLLWKQYNLLAFKYAKGISLYGVFL